MLHPFLDRDQLVTQRLIKPGYVSPRLTTSLQKFYGRHHKIARPCKISKSQMTMDLLLLCRCFLSSITAKTCYRICLYIWVTQRVSYKNQELFTLREHMSSPPDLYVHLFTFCVVLIGVSTFWIPCCDAVMSVTISVWKRCLVRLFLQLFVEGHVLFRLFMFVCVQWLFFLVLCSLRCQFLWIVHYWLPLRYYLPLVSACWNYTSY